VLFKVDENLPEELAGLLRDAGHDALTVRAQELQGSPDSVVLEVASREGRALVTLDQGFGDVRRYPPADHPGCIVLRLARQDKPHILSHFGLVLPLLTREPLAGRLWIVEENQVRIRL
jgi:predicted nuclease of predicted toxin-antitoxin system